MVSNPLARVDKQTYAWLKEQQSKTGYNFAQITQMIFPRIRNVQLPIRKKFTLKNIWKTDVGDVFREFKP